MGLPSDNPRDLVWVPGALSIIAKIVSEVVQACVVRIK